VFLLTVCHGLRVTEATSLRRKDFTLNGSTFYLTVQRLKGSEKTTQRVLSHADDLFDEHGVITQYLADLRPMDYLFADNGQKLSRWQVTTLVKKFGARAGVPQHKQFIHALKHTAGVFMRQAGCRIEEIQVALGHKNVNSSMAYLRISTDEADDARADAFAMASGRTPPSIRESADATGKAAASVASQHQSAIAVSGAVQ
jgi:integrase